MRATEGLKIELIEMNSQSNLVLIKFSNNLISCQNHIENYPSLFKELDQTRYYSLKEALKILQLE